MSKIIVPITPKRNNKRGDRRARQNKRSGGPSSMLGNLSLSKQFELKCATSIPTCVIRIKHAGFFSFGVTLNNQTLQPNTMGARAATLAGAYARYRIIKAIFKQVPTLGYGAQGRVYMGVSDDNGGEGGTSVVPADYLQISALRCSTNVSLGGEGEFEWKPVDPDKWYYTYTTTGNDGRQTVPGTFYCISDGFGQSGTFSGRIEAFFTLEFAGDII